MAVEAADNAMVSLTEVKEWLNLTGTNDDDFLQRQINDWSDTIETRLGRIIKSDDYEDEIHDGGKLAILPKNLPVTAIDSITIDDSELDSDEYELDKEGCKIRMKSGLPFEGGTGEILLSYTGGFASVPGDIKRAVRQLVALEYYLSGHGRKALAKRGESAPGGGNVTYERGPADQERVIDGLIRRYGRR